MIRGDRMPSIWTKDFFIERRPALGGDLTVDVAVIGAGMAGVLTALMLNERGIGCAVFEANRIGGGQTKGTTAKITSQHGLCYAKLTAHSGEAAARVYAEAAEGALRHYREIVAARGIDCELEDANAYVFGIDNAETLRREAEAAAACGLPASFIERLELPFPVAGAVCFQHQAQFHPLKFLAAAAEGLTIYEQSPVLRVGTHTLSVNGHTVRAGHIVFATHFPFVNFPGLYFIRMEQSRSYTIALRDAARPDGMYVDAREEGLSIRAYRDLVLLCDADHRTGENQSGGRYGALRRVGRTLFPGSREAARWSAQDCMTPDGLPYIGRYAANRPTWYVATGFNKWGMSGAMSAAELISANIAGERHPAEALFSPRRFNIRIAGAALQAGGHAVKGLWRQAFHLPDAAFDDLPIGQGGIVRIGHEKVGVYKDDRGKAHYVDTRCPHMGCQLEWNPDEKTWDCPCHGSRFDYRGRLIDNPAQDRLPSDMED